MIARRLPFANRIALALLGLALAARVLVPGGWMPVAAGQGFAITVCTGAGMVEGWVDADGKIHKQAPGKQNGDHCAFAGLGTPMLGGDVPQPTPPAFRADHGPVFGKAAAAVGQGLAAPPPPATGPPVTA